MIIAGLTGPEGKFYRTHVLCIVMISKTAGSFLAKITSYSCGGNILLFSTCTAS